MLLLKWKYLVRDPSKRIDLLFEIDPNGKISCSGIFPKRQVLFEIFPDGLILLRDGSEGENLVRDVFQTD